MIHKLARIGKLWTSSYCFMHANMRRWLNLEMVMGAPMTMKVLPAKLQSLSLCFVFFLHRKVCAACRLSFFFQAIKSEMKTYCVARPGRYGQAFKKERQSQKEPHCW